MALADLVTRKYFKINDLMSSLLRFLGQQSENKLKAFHDSSNDSCCRFQCHWNLPLPQNHATMLINITGTHFYQDINLIYLPNQDITLSFHLLCKHYVYMTCHRAIHGNGVRQCTKWYPIMFLCNNYFSWR